MPRKTTLNLRGFNLSESKLESDYSTNLVLSIPIHWRIANYEESLTGGFSPFSHFLIYEALKRLQCVVICISKIILCWPVGRAIIIDKNSSRRIHKGAGTMHKISVLAFFHPNHIITILKNFTITNWKSNKIKQTNHNLKNNFANQQV